ncbi:MAG: division/cell wall cluster transcriptional repressor MraZ, partial [Planctomycetota bacterium]
AAIWKPRIDAAVDVVRSKLQAGLLSQRVGQLQDLGRLLSARHKVVSLAARGRLVVPEGFRDFLAVEPGGDLLVVGAAVCVELWQPAAWNAFVTSQMPEFRKRIDELTA